MAPKPPSQASGSRSAKQRRQEQTAEAIEQRLEQQQRGAAQAVERWAQQRESLEEDRQVAAAQGASRPHQRALAQRQQKLAQRGLRLLERHDELVRQVLERKEKLSAIMGADQPTDADEMLWFLVKELKLAAALEQLAPPETRDDEKAGKQVQRRVSYAPQALNLIGLLGRYLGLRTNPELEAVVLTDLRWMSLLGFNAQEVENGTSRRSESLRGKTREGRGEKYRPTPLQATVVLQWPDRQAHDLQDEREHDEEGQGPLCAALTAPGAWFRALRPLRRALADREPL